MYGSTTDDDEQEEKQYKRTIQECDLEMTFYSGLTYDKDALKEFCNGDELLEYWFENKLKDLNKPPRVIWNRYYRVDKTHKREVKGSGLGLSIVKEILDHYGYDYGAVHDCYRFCR